MAPLRSPRHLPLATLTPPITLRRVTNPTDWPTRAKRAGYGHLKHPWFAGNGTCPAVGGAYTD